MTPLSGTDYLPSGERLSSYTQNIPHRICGFFLCRSSNMGIGVQCEPGGEMTEHTTHRLDIHTVLQGNGGEGMAEVVESDLRDSGSCQHSFQHIVHAVRRDGANLGGGGAMGAPPVAGGATERNGCGRVALRCLTADEAAHKPMPGSIADAKRSVTQNGRRGAVMYGFRRTKWALIPYLEMSG